MSPYEWKKQMIPMDEDDDLLVDLEDGPETFGDDDGPLQLEEPRLGALEAPDLPDDLSEEESNAPAARQGRQPNAAADDEAGEFDYESNERVVAAENRARQAEAQTVYTEGRARAAVYAQQRDTAKVALDSVNDKLRDANQRLISARENGDTRGEFELQELIGEIKGLRTQIENSAAQIPDPGRIMQEAEQKARGILAQEAQGKRVGNGIQARHPLAERWANSNKTWMSTNKRANDFVISQSNVLTRDGWDPNTPGFYSELSRRVQNAFPKLKVGTIQAAKKQPGQRPGAARSPVAPARSTSGGLPNRTAQNGSRTYTLTVDDQGAMRRANLDPKNPVHRKAFAKARIESAKRAQR